MPKQSFASWCQGFINDFYCIPCSSEVTIPVLTKITEKKVVRIYNIAQLATLILSIYFFVFHWKSWSTTVPISTGITMWIDSRNSVNKNVPEYCENPKWDYIYDSSFSYTNISCARPPTTEIFSKGKGLPGAFWISTFLQHKLFRLENCVDSTNPDKQCTRGENKVQVGKTKNEFVLGIDEFVLASQLSAAIPELDIDLRTIENTKVFIVTPSGRSIEQTNLKKLVIKKTIKDWIALFELGSLDTKVNDVYGIDGDVGNIVYRIGGINLYFEVELSNVYNDYSLPSDIFVKIHLKADKNWNRAIQPPSSTRDPDIVEYTYEYGVRFIWRMLNIYIL